MNNINFKAKYIKPVTVKHFDGKAYRNKFLNLIELEKCDKVAIDKVAKNWRAAFPKSIAQVIKHLGTKKERYGEKVLAITEQDCLFELVEPQKIQALASFHQDINRKISILSYLQVNPKYISEKYGTFKENVLKAVDKFFNPKFYIKPPKLYKNLGTVMLDSIKEIIPNDTLEIASLKKSQGFYLKNDCKFINIRKSLFQWKRK